MGVNIRLAQKIALQSMKTKLWLRNYWEKYAKSLLKLKRKIDIVTEISSTNRLYIYYRNNADNRTRADVDSRVVRSASQKSYHGHKFTSRVIPSDTKNRSETKSQQKSLNFPPAGNYQTKKNYYKRNSTEYRSNSQDAEKEIIM